MKPNLPLLRGFPAPNLRGLDLTGDIALALGHPADGRALSAAGEEVTRGAERAEPAQRKWEPEPHAQAIGVRVSPDPLQSTDRYRLVTPFKLKL